MTLPIGGSSTDSARDTGSCTDHLGDPRIVRLRELSLVETQSLSGPDEIAIARSRANSSPERTDSKTDKLDRGLVQPRRA